MWIQLKSNNFDDDDIGVNIRQQDPFASRKRMHTVG